MTVQELINRLDRLPKTLEVVLAKDAEGNEFRLANNYLTESRYDMYDKWRVSLVSDEEAGDRDRCVILWPVN